MACFRFPLENVYINKGPKMEGEKVAIYVFIPPCTHFGHQGRPMELQGDFREHFPLILGRFNDSFGSLFATETKHIKEKAPKRGPEIKVRDEQTTTSSTTKQVARTRWRGWAKPSGYY